MTFVPQKLCAKQQLGAPVKNLLGVLFFCIFVFKWHEQPRVFIIGLYAPFNSGTSYRVRSKHNFLHTYAKSCYIAVLAVSCVV